MTAAKQLRGNAGKGRKKGVPNRVTADVKQMVLTALKRAGGAQYLEEQAHKNPVAFMSLVGRVLPLQVRDPGGPILLEEIVLLALERREEQQERVQPLVIDATPIEPDALAEPRDEPVLGGCPATPATAEAGAARRHGRSPWAA
jgi:hypothetical protein